MDFAQSLQAAVLQGGQGMPTPTPTPTPTAAMPTGAELFAESAARAEQAEQQAAQIPQQLEKVVQAPLGIQDTTPLPTELAPVDAPPVDGDVPPPMPPEPERKVAKKPARAPAKPASTIEDMHVFGGNPRAHILMAAIQRGYPAAAIRALINVYDGIADD